MSDKVDRAAVLSDITGFTKGAVAGKLPRLLRSICHQTAKHGIETMIWRVHGDWGTSRLRLFRIVDDRVTARLEGPGIAALTENAGDALWSAISPWRSDDAPHSIHLIGMVGSRNGWVEMPYVDCPADAAAWRAQARTLTIHAVPVTLGAGLASVDEYGAPDVMRGEESQIFGALSVDPGIGAGRRLIALPGTHSKWVDVEDGRVTGFRTFLTGELFALLEKHSTLMRAGGGVDPLDESKGFDDGLHRAASRGHLIGHLFEARSAQLRLGRSESWARGFLSGLVIGCEVVEALEAEPALKDVALICDPKLAELYERAFAPRGIRITRLDGELCALAGLALLEREA